MHRLMKMLECQCRTEILVLLRQNKFVKNLPT
nr:MAG TPA: hypothetical protein [Caudoviricetes sp.]